MCLIGKLISIFSDVGFKDKENKEVVYFTSHVQFVCFSLTPAFLSKCAQSGQLLGQRVMRFETISPQLIRDNSVEEHEKYLYFLLSKNNLSAKFILLQWQFWHRDVSAQEFFSTMDVPAWDVTGLGYFVTGIFQQIDMQTLAPYILKCVPAPKHPLR